MPGATIVIQLQRAESTQMHSYAADCVIVLNKAGFTTRHRS